MKTAILVCRMLKERKLFWSLENTMARPFWLRNKSKLGCTPGAKRNPLGHRYLKHSFSYDEVCEIIGTQSTAPVESKKIGPDGLEYDYVFDVQLDEGGQTLKMGYNNGGMMRGCSK